MEDWAWNYVLDILEGQFGIPRQNVKPTDRLQDLVIDSLDAVELVMSLEDEFGKDIQETEIGKIATVADLADFIRGLR